MESLDTIMRYTIVLYQFKKGTKDLPIPHGSGLLLNYKGYKYFLSCAHVLLDGNEHKTFVLLKNNRTMSIAGHYVWSKPAKSKSRSDDKIDIAIVRLEQTCIDDFEKMGFRFLSEESLMGGNRSAVSQRYLLASIPATKVKINPKNKIVQPTPLFVHTKVSKQKIHENCHSTKNKSLIRI